ncbi:MAG: type II secretion system F family protein [Pseudomonadales bacterium]|nr:type II secretion system F family protein [Pseudomonadales bacterium]
MPEFSYIAYDSQGQYKTGNLTAASREEAMRVLVQKNLFVQNLRSKFLSARRTGRVKDKDILTFIKQMGSLIKAGMPLVDALSIAGNRGTSKILVSVIGSIKVSVQEGKSFTDACRKFPDIFDEILLCNLKTSEKSGDLFLALKEYQRYLTQKLEFQSTLRKALAYPTFLVLTLIIVLGFLFVFVVPSFSELFESFNAELPLATRVVLSIADFFPLFALATGSLFFLSFIFSKLFSEHLQFQRKLDAIKCRLPLIGPILTQSRSAQVARNISTMLLAGMPLVSALENLQQTFAKTSIGLPLEIGCKKVMDGGTLSKALNQAGLLSEQALMLVEAGENSGELGPMLREVAEYYESEVSERLSIFTSLFEPVLMLLIGVLVGGVIISMYLPIFYLAEVVK